jgi:hypothetical protein
MPGAVRPEPPKARKEGRKEPKLIIIRVNWSGWVPDFYYKTCVSRQNYI